jgi:hypothetical protein
MSALLVDVEPAHIDAAPLALAGRSVRNAATEARQAGGAHRDLEDERSPASAAGDAGSGTIRVVADTHASPQHLTHGQIAPLFTHCRSTHTPTSDQDDPMGPNGTERSL